MTAKKKASKKKAAAKRSSKAPANVERAKDGSYPETKILSRLFDVKDGHKLSVAKKHGAYANLEKAVSSMGVGWPLRAVSCQQ